MGDSTTAGFAKFVPGFDFLQNLAKGASQALPQMPNLTNWLAPTLSIEELDKRIDELKAVHFWLDQNTKALGATVQALEVQKMTLATLKGMNFNIADLANAFKLKAADTATSGMQKVSAQAASAAKTLSGVALQAEGSAQKVLQAAAPTVAVATNGLVDPMQLWTSLSQQFQHIAVGAMKELGKAAAVDLTKKAAGGVVQQAVKASKKASVTGSKKVTAVKKVLTKGRAKTVPPASTRQR